jgi:hypothetical protein
MSYLGPSGWWPEGEPPMQSVPEVTPVEPSWVHVATRIMIAGVIVYVSWCAYMLHELRMLR